MTDKPIRKAGRNSGGNWKKPKPRKKDPWRLTDGWCNQNVISATTVNMTRPVNWARDMNRD